MNPVPPTNVIADKDGRITPQWQAFFSSLHDFLGPVGNSGTTTNRPLDSSRNPFYVGQSYFDTTLGYPVYVKSRNPTVWVDGGGTVR